MVFISPGFGKDDGLSQIYCVTGWEIEVIEWIQGQSYTGKEMKTGEGANGKKLEDQVVPET